MRFRFETQDLAMIVKATFLQRLWDLRKSETQMTPSPNDGTIE